MGLIFKYCCLINQFDFQLQNTNVSHLKRRKFGKRLESKKKQFNAKNTELSLYLNLQTIQYSNEIYDSASDQKTLNMQVLYDNSLACKFNELSIYKLKLIRYELLIFDLDNQRINSYYIFINLSTHSQMEKEQLYKLIKNQYQINYQKLSDYDLNIVVYNFYNLNKYVKNNVKLTNINAKGLQMAIKDQKDFKSQFKQCQANDTTAQPFLQIKVSFKSSFVANISETLSIPLERKISQTQLFKLKIQNLNEKMKKITQNQNNEQLIVITPLNKELKSNINPDYGYDDMGGGSMDYQIIQFETIDLPNPGKYFVELTMLLKCPRTYMYFYTNANYQGPFPSGGMAVNNTSSFVPFKLGFYLDTRTSKEKSQKIYVYDIVDYPIEAQNIVITLKKQA